MGATNVPPSDVAASAAGGLEGAAAPEELRAAGAGWLQRVVAFDLAVMRRLNVLSLPRPVAWPLIFLVRIGDGWLWFLVALLLWRFLPYAELKPVVGHCVFAIAVSLAVYWPVKLAVRRRRPFDVDPSVTAKVPPLDKWSFPSGHTMNNLSVALTLALYVPDILYAAFCLPLLLGGLRMVFGVHFFSDIAGGAVLGAISYALAALLFPIFG